MKRDNRFKIISVMSFNDIPFKAILQDHKNPFFVFFFVQCFDHSDVRYLYVSSAENILSTDILYIYCTYKYTLCRCQQFLNLPFLLFDKVPIFVGGDTIEI